LRLLIARSTSMRMIAPTMEPMMPLGRRFRPSPAIRLPSRPPTNEPSRR